MSIFFVEITPEQEVCGHAFAVDVDRCRHCGLEFSIWRALEYLTKQGAS